MWRMLFVLWFTLCVQLPVTAAEYYVAAGSSNGEGSFLSPFNNFQSAIEKALPGDVIYIMPGVYQESLRITRGGTAGNRLLITAFAADQRPIISALETELIIDDSFVTVEGLILDGDFDASDVVKIEPGGDNAIIRNCEIRNGTRDGIDLDEADDVLIENCEIHHMLAGTFSNQQDAHGIVATRQKNLTIRSCEIYYVTGDCFQTDPSRDTPLWDNVLIENCTLWTGPLPADAADWNAGEVPGENAIDTKINEDAVSSSYRAKITLKNIVAYGFVPGYINNRAAFNIKEKVDCQMTNVRVYNNEIAFRLRGPTSRGGAHLTLINVIAYDNEKTFRTEDELEVLKIYNGTFDKDSGDEYFENTGGGYDPDGFDLRNCLFTGSMPDEGAHDSNMLANSSFFLDLAGNDYHLAENSPAIDSGEDIAGVSEGYDGNPRSSGSFDVGAYEYASPLPSGIVVNLKVMLEGPFNGNEMNNTLNMLNKLPLSQPFNRAPWQYDGEESVAEMPADVVDWLLLTLFYFESGSWNTIKLPVFLKKDGMIAGMDGVSLPSVAGPETDYYIKVSHRNHLDIASASQVALSNNSPFYDFTTSQNQAQGMDPMNEVATGVFAMIAGDGNKDGGCDALDKNLVWRIQNGFPWHYNNWGDYNLDGGVDALDLNLYWRVNNGKASQVP